MARIERLDSQPPLKANGNPLPLNELLKLAEVKPDDVSKAVERFQGSVPDRYEGLLG